MIPARRLTITEQVGPFTVAVGFKQDHTGGMDGSVRGLRYRAWEIGHGTGRASV
jgi:hypothetical protein